MVHGDCRHDEGEWNAYANRLFRALLALCFTVACCCTAEEAARAPTPCPAWPRFYVDPAFTPAERRALEYAAGQWCRASDSPLACPQLVGEAEWHKPSWQVAPKDDPTLVLIRIRDTDPAPTIWRSTLAEDDPLRDETLALKGIWANKETLVLFTPNLYTPGAWRQTAVHELGHALGLEHGEGRCVKAVGGDSACVDRGCFEALCRRYECGPRAAPTCEE